ncbi:MAG: P-loop NTPase [Candidatus Coatesbacteria bacterium]|nr:P-loop NTPase [Candidatus Coatesbacteria bacterium]
MSDNKECQGCSSSDCSESAANKHIKNELEDHEEITRRLSNIEHKVLVLSGKGGVGKSTVAANLAFYLAQQGKKVGLLDVDIHGPSIPKLLGLEDAKPQGIDKTILPIPYSNNLKVMSIGFMLRSQDDAVIWRGPMKYGVIKQFLMDVQWGDLDYLIVDSPPGTGDEPLSIAQMLQKPEGAIIVTTPQDLSVLDVRKCINFCRKLHIPVMGVVENMSGFVCPGCGERIDIFKAGGGARMANELDVPYLGSIPIDQAVTMASDAGKSFIVEAKDSGATAAFQNIAKKVLEYHKQRLGDASEYFSGGARTDTAASHDSSTEENRMRIALPLAGGKLSPHFGHCNQFAIFDVDKAGGKTIGMEMVDAPPHEPGLLPKWLKDKDVEVVIAGGMGQRAKGLFEEQNIEVFIGVPSDDPQTLVSTYLAGGLESGDNLCDH